MQLAILVVSIRIKLRQRLINDTYLSSRAYTPHRISVFTYSIIPCRQHRADRLVSRAIDSPIISCSASSTRTL